MTITVASTRNIAERWKQNYGDPNRWYRTFENGNTPAEIYDQLLKLGSNPDPDKVANVIGNPSWSFVRCDQCETYVDRTITLGEEYRRINICGLCLDLAASILINNRGAK